MMTTPTWSEQWPNIAAMFRVDQINLWNDDMRRINKRTHAFHPFKPMTDKAYEYRYEQRGDEFTLRRWHNGEQQFSRGYEHNILDWLRRILDTAKVAGVIRTVETPPPDIILWFRTDTDYNLIEFIEMT
jgi:Ni/Co efflux regulator RcnB